MALDVEALLQPSPLVDRQSFDELEHDRRDIERPAVRFQREAEREPVRVRGFERRRERDRPLVQPERPCPVEFDAPALGTELGDPSRDEADAGRGRGVVPVAERREDDIRLAQFARQGVVVTQQVAVIVAMALRRFPQRLLERRLARAIAPDDRETFSADAAISSPRPAGSRAAAPS